MSTGKVHHNWKHTDDAVAYYLWKHGDSDLPWKMEVISTKLGMSVSSMKMRMSNFKNVVHGAGGLSHPARQSHEVYKQLKDLGKNVLRDVAIKAISAA